MSTDGSRDYQKPKLTGCQVLNPPINVICRQMFGRQMVDARMHYRNVLYPVSLLERL